MSLKLTATETAAIVMTGGQVMESEVKIAIRDMGVIDTGNLLGSITHELASADERSALALVGTNVEYAAYPEFGWSHGSHTEAARPYMRQSFDEKRDTAIDMMTKTLLRFVKRGEV